MAKNYIPNKRGKTLLYKQEDLVSAVEAVERGELSIRKAAQQFSVPRSTIADRVSGKFSIRTEIVHGRKPALPKEVEDRIVSTLKTASERGIGVSRKQLLQRTGTLVRRLRLNTPFTNGTPGNDWWEGLKKRHPELSIRKPEKLSSTRARALNTSITDGYFKYLGELLTQLNLKDKPNRIWNADETGLQFEHKPVKVIAQKGAKSVVGKTSNSRTNITVMACGNAAGRHMPPMLIIKGKTSLALHGFNTEAAPPSTKWTYQEKGWMSDQIGEQWFQEVFLSHCGPERPQLLIIDGHSSHETLGLLELAKAEKIEILCLPPHCTHFLQPLDRTVFGPFKSSYDKVCSNYITENSLNSVNKWSFPGLFRQAFDAALSESNLQNGFKACGIYPFDPDCLPHTALHPSIPSDTPLPSSTSGPFVESASSLRCPLSPEVPAQSASNMGVNVQPTEMSISTAEANSSEAASSTMPSESLTMQDDFSDINFIENPEHLLDLINSGLIEVVASTEESVDISAELGESSTEPDSSEPVLDWSSEVTNMFLPPPTKTEIQEKHMSQRKRQTQHRLLTSNDIMEEKRMAFQKKSEKEQAKIKREQIRKEKLAKKQGK